MYTLFFWLCMAVLEFQKHREYTRVSWFFFCDGSIVLRHVHAVVCFLSEFVRASCQKIRWISTRLDLESLKVHLKGASLLSDSLKACGANLHKTAPTAFAKLQLGVICLCTAIRIQIYIVFKAVLLKVLRTHTTYNNTEMIKDTSITYTYTCTDTHIYCIHTLVLPSKAAPTITKTKNKKQ